MNVYISAPKSVYFDSERFTRKIDLVKRYFPNEKILIGRDLYKNSSDWLGKWPGILAELEVLIFFTDWSGFIGAGVYKEITDCLANGKKVHFLSDSDTLIPYDRIDLILTGDDYSQFAEVEVRK